MRLVVVHVLLLAIGCGGGAAGGASLLPGRKPAAVPPGAELDAGGAELGGADLPAAPDAAALVDAGVAPDAAPAPPGDVAPPPADAGGPYGYPRCPEPGGIRACRVRTDAGSDLPDRLRTKEGFICDTCMGASTQPCWTTYGDVGTETTCNPARVILCVPSCSSSLCAPSGSDSCE